MKHEWIYQYFWMRNAKGVDLNTNLRCRKKRNNRYGSHDHWGKSTDRVSIWWTSGSSRSCHTDTVSISLNKGLSAPVGALLAGGAELIKTAVEIRQRFGGGWQSPGVLAAAGIVALEQMTSNLAADNENARKLAFGLNQMDGVTRSTVKNN